MKRPTNHQELPFNQTNDWRRFVVHKHHATRLHYDVRMEHAGVLKSWVVPDGPCLDPAQPRLAILVNDHAINCCTFEGTIPAGRYGAGPVMLWDVGWWRTDQNVDQAFRDGRLNFQFRGRKLSGNWSLTRIRSSSGRDQEKWHLKKEDDTEAKSLSEMDILSAQPLSIATGRTLAEIASEPSHFAPRKSRRDSDNQHSLFPDDLES